MCAEMYDAEIGAMWENLLTPSSGYSWYSTVEKYIQDEANGHLEQICC
jgi:hypothetical protein